MNTKQLNNTWIKSICAAVLLSSAMMSCQKAKFDDSNKLITQVGPTAGENPGTTPPATDIKCTISKIESYSSENNGPLTRSSSSLVTLDSEGRVIKEEIEQNGGRKVTVEYAYAADFFTVKTTSMAGIQTEKYSLDATGRIIKYSHREDFLEQITDYFYNSEGYMSQRVAYINSVQPNGTTENIDKMVTIFSYLNGNLIKTETTGYAMGVQYAGPKFVAKFEYDTSKPFVYLNGYNFWQRDGRVLPVVKYENGSTLFGKMPTNQLTFRKEVNYDNQNQPYDLVRTYTYLLDSKSNVTQMIESSDNQGKKSMKESKVTYNCE